MNKWQHWSQTENGRSPITGLEIAEGPIVFDLAPVWESRAPHPNVAVYHAQMIHCGSCAQLLDPGESCEHLSFDGGPPATIRVLQGGTYLIGWRSFSPQHVKEPTP